MENLSYQQSSYKRCITNFNNVDSRSCLRSLFVFCSWPLSFLVALTDVTQHCSCTKDGVLATWKSIRLLEYVAALEMWSDLQLSDCESIDHKIMLLFRYFINIFLFTTLQKGFLAFATWSASSNLSTWTISLMTIPPTKQETSTFIVHLLPVRNLEFMVNTYVYENPFIFRKQ